MTSRRDFVKQTGVAAAGLLAAQLPLNTLANAEERKFRELRRAIAAHAKLLKIPGLAVAVVEDGKTTYVQTEGFADVEKKIPVRRDHIFPVASVTKTFAAVTLMQYEQEGKISMDDYILDYPFIELGQSATRLQSPNIKIRHVLSHTSEGEPGSNYMYNGGRYNFVYGIFEKISGNTKRFEAFAGEAAKRIFRPLGMEDTLPGYPADKSHPAISRIVTTYNFDREHQTFNPEKNLPNWNTLWTSSGLMTTIDDLARYSNALDQNTLLSAESYKKLTTPFVTTSGRQNNYGMGWSTQQLYGRGVHWHYGYDDSYAALIVRVPQDKLTFILLSNSAGASEPFLLGYGGLLNSPFAMSFFKHVVLHRSGQFYYSGFSGERNKDAVFYDELYSQAMMRNYLEQTYHEHKGEGAELMKYLAKNDPVRFQRADIALLAQLAGLGDAVLKPQMGSVIAAYQASGWFYPDIHREIAIWHERNGNPETSREWYHKLADSTGYGEQWPVKNACNVLGKYYLEQGEKEKGRTYLWRETLYNSSNKEDVNRQIDSMNSLSKKH